MPTTSHQVCAWEHVDLGAFHGYARAGFCPAIPRNRLLECFQGYTNRPTMFLDLVILDGLRGILVFQLGFQLLECRHPRVVIVAIKFIRVSRRRCRGPETMPPDSEVHIELPPQPLQG